MLYDEPTRQSFIAWAESEAARAHDAGETFTVHEWGVKRSNRNKPTIQRDLFPTADEYVGIDFADGLDVDLVADIHDCPQIPDGAANAIVCVSVMEHVNRPWIAMPELARTLAPGGRMIVTTHQSFPIHGYPQDYWRFTREAMALLGADAGLDVVATAYAYPAKITPPAEVTEWNPAAEVYLNVSGLYAKP